MSLAPRQFAPFAAGAALLVLQSHAWAAASGGQPACDRAFRPAPTAEAPPSDADKAAAASVLAEMDGLRARLKDGEALPKVYAPAERLARLAREASDPLLAELFRRTAKDQFWRTQFIVLTTRSDWAAGLSCGALAIIDGDVARKDMLGVDADNTAWLKQQLRAHGWFKRSVYGDEADGAAFLLVQHADEDRPFQKEVLAILGPLVEAGETTAKAYAYLFDRVAVAEKRPQRYGTQGRCTGPKTWTEDAVEDPDGLDARRAKVSLPSMAEYRRGFVQLCP